MANFWASQPNILMFKQLISGIVKDIPHPTVVSQLSMQGDEWASISLYKDNRTVLPELSSCLPELPSCDWFFDCAKACYKTCVVLSNYTDIAVALLYHYPPFKKSRTKQARDPRWTWQNCVISHCTVVLHTSSCPNISSDQGLITSQFASNIKGFASTHNDRYILDYLPLPTQHHRSTTISVSARG